MSSWRYLLCRLYCKELMLPLCSTHISKCPVIGYVSGDEGDLVHHMLVFNHLSFKEEEILMSSSRQ